MAPSQSRAVSSKTSPTTTNRKSAAVDDNGGDVGGGTGEGGGGGGGVVRKGVTRGGAKPVRATQSIVNQTGKHSKKGGKQQKGAR
jgi:hypothetical protein